MDFLGGIFWENFFGRIFLGGIFGRNYLAETNKDYWNVNEIYGFVKILG